MSSSTSPTTPIRPKRSLARLSMAASSTTTLVASPEDPLTPPLPSASSTPSTAASHLAQTPASPSPAYISNRKSISSIRRKPVPLSLEDEHELEMAQLRSARSPKMSSFPPRSGFTLPPGAGTPVDPFPTSPRSALSALSTAEGSESQPPRYLLPVDLPPSFSSSSTTPYTLNANPFAVDTSDGSSFNLHEDLPRYAEETQTEPKTLARGLWKWGFLCPLLWLLGMCILWIPLRPVEEEQDAEQAQKLEEMIAILRRTELKYAKRCAYSFAIFIGLIVAIVAIVIGVQYATHHL